MNNFKAIYRILKLLDKHKGDESFDSALISPEACKLDFASWEQIMIELQISGYIRGVAYDQALGDKFPHIEEPIAPQITLAGMEFLENNSALAKAKELLKAAGEIIG